MMPRQEWTSIRLASALGIETEDFANDRPYRAPELIFAPHDYGCEVDIWSFGCTVAELFTPKQTLFSDGADYDGLSSDLVLLGSVISTLGTPTSETWPESKVKNKMKLMM